MNLDDLLARSGPSVTAPSAELDEDLREMTRASAPRSLSLRPVRLALGAGVAATVLGLGAVGAAAVISDGALWFTSTASGDSCEMEFSVRPVGPQNAASGEVATIMEGRTTWPSAAEQDEVAAAARRYLASYDFDAIDRDSAVKEADAAQRRIISEAAPGEAQPLLVGDDLEMHAVSRKAVRDLTAHLEGLGMDPHVVVSVVGSSNGCGE